MGLGGSGLICNNGLQPWQQNGYPIGDDYHRRGDLNIESQEDIP